MKLIGIQHALLTELSSTMFFFHFPSAVEAIVARVGGGEEDFELFDDDVVEDAVTVVSPVPPAQGAVVETSEP